MEASEEFLFKKRKKKINPRTKQYKNPKPKW